MNDIPTIPEYDFAGHAFVWARPRDRNWDKIDGTNGLGSGPREFRPCMVKGHDTGRRIFVLCSQYGYPMDEFEIAGECKPPVELAPAAELEPLPYAPSR